VLALVLTVVDDAEKLFCVAGSIAILIVPDVYPVPPSDIVIASTLPPVAKTASPTAVPELNATVGSAV